MVASIRRMALPVYIDIVVFVLGLAVALPALERWLSGADRPSLPEAISTALVLVMSRFPLVLSHRAGDVVIGFETCALVFLVLTGSPAQTLALWSIGMALAHGTSPKPWRSRIFNVGLTILGGALLVLVVAATRGAPGQNARELAAVMAGCSVYFLFDLLMTAGSLAIEDRSSLGAALRWQAVPLGLACFVSVDTLGYLAALLQRSQPAWTLLLLLVPVGTILVAVGAVSRARLAQRRLSGLLEAATQAPDWSDDVQIERSLIVQAEKTLRHTTAALRSTPAVPPEIGTPIHLDGQPVQHLVVRRIANGQHFDGDDQSALDALAAVGVSAFSRRRLAREMTYLARHDALTGLNNRAVFADGLANALAGSVADHLSAVLYVDLDGFKEVNDRFGHETGDRLLAAVAHRLHDALRPEDTAARLGGDEFGILLHGLADEAQAEAVGRRVLEVLARPFSLGDLEIRVQASIGIAYARQDAVSAEVLLHSADTAMYAAKSLGKGQIQRFVPAMRAKDVERLEIEAALRRAVLADELQVHYQPIVNLSTGAIEGFEALARWTDPQLGSVPPDRFIAVAERIGLIRTLGMQILRTAHRDAVEMVRQAGRPLRLAVNLSPMQISDPELLAQVADYRRSTPDVTLVLELTEGTMLGDDPVTLAAIRALKDSGVLLAIDDFGTGYSSVGYLHRLPLDILKIDKVFVQQLHDPRSLALVQGVIAMAEAMHLTVITEGVEDWDSAAAIRELGSHLAQGYLFSRPVPLPEAIVLAAAGCVDVSPMYSVLG